MLSDGLGNPLVSGFHPTRSCKLARDVTSACRLQEADAELIVGAFRAFWASQSQGGTAAGNDSLGHFLGGSSYASPVRSPVDNRTTTQEQSGSGAEAVGAAAKGGRTAAEPQELRRQGSDGAADAADDIIRAASGAHLSSQGRCNDMLLAAPYTHLWQRCRESLA